MSGWRWLLTSRSIMVVAGARPNFVKVAPLLKAFGAIPHWRTLLVHTGQHYDLRMSSVFFKDLAIPDPDICLNVGSGSHASQTAKILKAFERCLLKERPALVVVVGDVNSTLACALAASKMHIPLAHVEAGLRSFDRAMPEEINRVVADRLSDYLFVTEKSGIRNLKKEGVDPKKIFFTGNVMINSLLTSLKAVERSQALKDLGLKAREYAVVTLHRPSNVDSKEALIRIGGILERLSRCTLMVFPIHPRTRQKIRRFGLEGRFDKTKNLLFSEPLGYVDFIRLVRDSLFVLTDSGGIQEEATVLRVPCLTMRDNTERPATVEEGTNELVGQNEKKILFSVRKIQAGRWKKSAVPRYWDGRAACRIAEILAKRV